SRHYCLLAATAERPPLSSGGRAEEQYTPRNQDRGRRLLQRLVRRGVTWVVRSDSLSPRRRGPGPNRSVPLGQGRRIRACRCSVPGPPPAASLPGGRTTAP